MREKCGCAIFNTLDLDSVSPFSPYRKAGMWIPCKKPPTIAEGGEALNVVTNDAANVVTVSMTPFRLHFQLHDPVKYVRTYLKYDPFWDMGKPGDIVRFLYIISGVDTGLLEAIL